MGPSASAYRSVDAGSETRALSPTRRPETAHRLAGAHLFLCADCGDLIEAKGPVRIFVRPSGEFARSFCGRCVQAHAERRAIDGAKERLLRRIGPAGRGKGMLFKQALREDGTPLAILRLACDELVDEGVLTLERGKLHVRG